MQSASDEGGGPKRSDTKVGETTRRFAALDGSYICMYVCIKTKQDEMVMVMVMVMVMGFDSLNWEKGEEILSYFVNIRVYGPSAP